MRKGLLLFFASFSMLALALVSCTNDETLDYAVDGATGKAVEFRALTDKSNNGLRAAITREDNVLSFTVTGIKTDGTNLIPLADDPYLFNGFGITRGEDASNAWAYTPKRYWPSTGKVDFYAYSPSSSKNVGTGLLGFYPDQAENVISYEVPTIKEDDAQEDFLVARRTERDESTGDVVLNFHHALSRVMFFAKTTHPGLTYHIYKIELVNLYNEGELDLTSAMIEETGNLNYTLNNPLNPWDTSLSSKINYTVDMADSPINVLKEFKSVLGKTGAVLVLPQETELLLDADMVSGPSGSEFAIRVEYKAFIEDIYYAGTKTDNAVKYFAVREKDSGDPLTFEMGRQYNFYMTFKGDAGDEIKFDIDVTEWKNDIDVYLPTYAEYEGLLGAGVKAAAGLPATGSITYAAIKDITSLTLTVQDLKGIEHFPNLTEVKIAGNYDTVDLSGCNALTTVSVENGGVVTTIILPFNQTVTVTENGGQFRKAVDIDGNVIATGTL